MRSESFNWRIINKKYVRLYVCFWKLYKVCRDLSDIVSIGMQAFGEEEFYHRKFILK